MSDLDPELDLTTATTYLMDMTAFAGKLEQQLEDTRKERDELLALVEQVEWTWNGLWHQCPWCREIHEDQGHAPDCPRQAAIAKATREAR